MATTPEGAVKDKVKALLHKYGVMYWMPRGTTFGSAGVSDFCCLFNGWFIAIETKATRGRLTALQQLFLQNVVKHGGIALVIRPMDMEMLTGILKKLANGEGETAYEECKTVVLCESVSALPTGDATM